METFFLAFSRCCGFHAYVLSRKWRSEQTMAAHTPNLGRGGRVWTKMLFTLHENVFARNGTVVNLKLFRRNTTERPSNYFASLRCVHTNTLLMKVAQKVYLPSY